MNKQTMRQRRGMKTKMRIKLSGSTRLVVSRSNVHTYAEIVLTRPDGDEVLVSSSTMDKELRSEIQGKKKVEQALLVGKLLAKRALDKGLTKVAFDRSGYKYHGRIKALAEGAREAGLEF